VSFFFFFFFGIIYLYSTVLGQQESCYKNSDNVVYRERGWISITQGSATLEINVLKKLGKPRIPHGGSGQGGRGWQREFEHSKKVSKATVPLSV